MKQIRQRFATNWIGFWEDWKVLMFVFFVALLADAVSTMHFMRYEGVEAEMHPIVNLVSRWVGPVLGPLIGALSKAAAGVIAAVYFRRIAGFIFVLSSLISVWAAWFNLWGYRIYEPNIYVWWPF